MCQASGCPEWSRHSQSKGKPNVLVSSMALTLQRSQLAGELRHRAVYQDAPPCGSAGGGAGSNEAVGGRKPGPQWEATVI